MNFEGVRAHNNCFDELPKNAKPTGETLADGRKVYTTVDANGNEIKIYPGLEGRWYDLNKFSPTFKVDVNNVINGSTKYKLLNDPPANSHFKLSNGTEFKTNEYGFVEEISFTPSLNKQARDARQTAVGKEGLNTDVGGHLQACSLDGTCDRFNLFPQDAKFNNSAYKRWGNQIKNALKDGKTVNSINIQLDRSNVGSARPDSLVINYSIDGKEFVRKFINKAKQ